MGKISNYIKNNKQKVIRMTIAILIIAAVTVGIYFTLKALGIMSVDSLREKIEKFGTSAWVIYLLLQVVCTSLLCFVPATSMTFILVGMALFGNWEPWKVFVLCFSGVILASVVMDLIGRFGGSRLIQFIIGKDEYDSTMELVQEKGMVYVPVMYLLPVFPDDAICMIVGATKMNFLVHLIEIITCRGIGCATIVFGLNFIPKDITTFTSKNIFDYVVVALVIILGVSCIFYIARKIDKRLSQYLKKKKELKASSKN